MNHLFLASTPFNAITASMLALNLPESDNALLALIDQSASTETFQQALFDWADAPFVKIERISNKSSNQGKRAARKAAFDHLDGILEQFKPTRIYTGNDRRVEFQYCMATCSGAEGIYVDDGLYSYLGLESHWFKDRIVNNALKKLAYGRWWKQPPTVGASVWISRAILAFPELAFEGLKHNPIEQLPSNLHHPAFRSLSRLCGADVEQQLSEVDHILLLPHSSNLAAIEHNIKPWLERIAAQTAYIKIAVKHHPRSEDPTSINKQLGLPHDIVLLNAASPIEVLLPMIPDRCKIWGDASTALLTSKWLKPDLDVSTLSAARSDTWNKLLDRLGIRTFLEADPAAVKA